MGKFGKFKKKVADRVNEKVKRIRLSYQISKQAIGEIKRAKSVDELLNKHLSNGVCSLCGNETDIIKSVGKCVNCSTSGDKWAKHFKKISHDGQCVICKANGLVSNDEVLCFNCYIKRRLIK
jgi:hypothetical protein